MGILYSSYEIGTVPIMIYHNLYKTGNSRTMICIGNLYCVIDITA